MQLGMIGLGRMGANMVRRLMHGGHECVVHDLSPKNIRALVAEGAVGAATLKKFVAKLRAPRAIWLMLPAAAVDTTLSDLAKLLAPGDIVIDGGNSHYPDDIRRALALKKRRIHFVDVGTSGGVWGVERGYCLMIGGRLSGTSTRSSRPWPRAAATLPAPRAGTGSRAGRQKKATSIAAPPAAAIS